MHTASDSAVEHSLEGGAFLFLEGKKWVYCQKPQVTHFQKWVCCQKHKWPISKSGYIAKNTSGVFPKVGILPKTQVAYFQGTQVGFYLIHHSSLSFPKRCKWHIAGET